jgi:hypothetical protein
MALYVSRLSVIHATERWMFRGERTLSATHTPDEPLSLPTAVAVPHDGSHRTACLQFSTRSTSSSPVQKGVGSLSTAIAAIDFNGFGGTHRTCRALG